MRFWVGNAKQAASFYTSRMGFEYVAYQVSEFHFFQSIKPWHRADELLLNKFLISMIYL